MNTHQQFIASLPLYVAGQLTQPERLALEQHIKACPDCRVELGLWRAIGAEITTSNAVVLAPLGVAERALARIHARHPFQRAFQRTISLLCAQVKLVRGEMWPASAAVMAIGIIVTLLVRKVEIIRFIAPLVAAASLAAIFGPEHDPAFELTLATPTSPWKVLLARLTLVHGYNLLLALVASLFMLTILPSGLLWSLILGWLGPMTFLSALALLLSLWIGTGNSVAVAYGLWIIQFPQYELVFPASASTAWTLVLGAYRQFWSNPLLLIGLGLFLLIVTLWYVGRSSLRLVIP